MLRYLSVLCLSVLCLAGALASASAATRWERFGPDGGRVTALAVCPSNPQVLYAGGPAVFRSVDAGAHWLPTADVFPSFGPEALAPRVTALAASPMDPDRVLAASPQGLFLTTDGGASWRRAGGIAVPVASLAFADAMRVAASGDGALFFSDDAGQTWTSFPLPTLAALCEDPLAPGGFFGAGQMPDAESRSLYHSPDGRVWTPLPLIDLRPAALRPAPGGADVYAAVSGPGGGVYQVSRDGASARRLSDIPSVALAVPESAPGWILSGSDPACEATPVYRSMDGGARWDPLRIGFGLCGFATFAMGPDLTPIAGTERGGILACGPDDRWRPMNEGLAMARIGGVWRSNDGSVLIASASDALFRSADDGQSWMRCRETGARMVLAVSAAKTGRLFHVGINGLERSEDFGRTWLSQMGGISGADVARVLLHPTLPNTLYAVTADGAVYRSTTSITSWKPILAAFPVAPESPPDFVLAPSDPGTLYALRPDGLHRSEDGGITWAWRADMPATALLAVDPTDSARLYRALTTGADVRVDASPDGGATWVALRNETGVASGGFAATFIATDARRAGRILLGTNRGLRVSDDAGTTWRVEPIGPAGTFCAAWAPGGSGEDLLATDGAGLLRSISGPVLRVDDLPTAILILRIALTTPSPTAEQVAFGDRDGDGRLTRADALLCLRAAVSGAGST